MGDRRSNIEVSSKMENGFFIEPAHLRRTPNLRRDPSSKKSLIFSKPLPSSNNIPIYTMGGSCRLGARRGGDAGRGQAERVADGLVRPEYNRPSHPQGIERICSERLFLSNQKPGHTTRGSGRAAHGGAAGRGGPGRMGRRRVCYRTQPSLVPSSASKTTVLNIFSKARTRELLCKP